jgi:hypothetical protein
MTHPRHLFPLRRDAGLLVGPEGPCHGGKALGDEAKAEGVSPSCWDLR